MKEKGEERVLFRVDASRQAGRGHLSRCLGLAEAFVRKRITPIFVVPQPDPVIRRILKQYGWRVEGISDVAAKTPASLVRAWRQEKIKFIVVDTYTASEAYFKALRKNTGALIVQFDDLGQRRFYSSVVISTRSSRPSILPEGIRWLSGPSYIPLPPAVRRLKLGHPHPKTSKPILLVSLGYSRAALKVSGLFRALEGFPVEVHIASDAVLADAMRRKFPESSKKWTFHINAAMPPLYEKAWLAICAGGMTALELAHWGVPMLGVQLAKNQAGNLSQLSRTGCLSCLQKSELRDPRRLRTRILRFITDKSRLQRMAQAGRRLVDGRGADRAVKEILSLTEQYSWN